MSFRLFTLLLMVSTFAVNGQTLISVGIKGGVAISNQIWEYSMPSVTNRYDFKAGLNSMLNAEFSLGKHISLSTDLGFIQKGMRLRIEQTDIQFPEGTGEFLNVYTTRNYISFTPHLKANYKVQLLSIYALLGPRIDYFIGQKSEAPFMFVPDQRNAILGISCGIGAEYKVNKFGFLLEIQGQPNLTALLDQKPTKNAAGLKIKEQAFVVNSGIRLYIN